MGGWKLQPNSKSATITDVCVCGGGHVCVYACGHVCVYACARGRACARASCMRLCMPVCRFRIADVQVQVYMYMKLIVSLVWY